jgi:hypothetical protein
MLVPEWIFWRVLKLLCWFRHGSLTLTWRNEAGEVEREETAHFSRGDKVTVNKKNEIVLELKG